MGKKKSTGDQKAAKKEVNSADTMTSQSDKHSNKKTKKGVKKVSTSASASASTSPTASTPVLSGSLIVVIGLSVLVVLGAVIVMNKDVQNYLVSFTPMGSNPLEHILSNDNEKRDTVGKNSASTDQEGSIQQEDIHITAAKSADSNKKDKTNNVNDNKSKSNTNNNNIKDDSSETEAKDHVNKETEGSGGNDKDGADKQKTRVKRKDYLKHEITNKADFKIRKKLDAAEDLREQGKLKEALNKYTSLLSSSPESPRALFGKALVTDKMAEQKQSNQLLEEAMDIMNRALRLPDTPKQLKVEIGNKLAARQSFRGWEGKAAGTWRYLMDTFPDDVTFQQKYATSFLIMGKHERARDVYKKILEKHPDDSYSLLHLGFIVKSIDTDYKVAIPLLQKGIDLDTEGVAEGKFFYHLGDAYLRTNQSDMAQAVYIQGAERGLFLSQYQRSLYNADTPLTGRPWWTPEQTTYQSYFKDLEKHWKTIREEGLAQLNTKTGSFLPEEENLREAGDWKQFTLFQRGRKDQENCKKVPKTCAMLEKIPDATGCTRGQIKYSVMHPGVHVWPHTGPTNCRIRAHLGLKVPSGPRIRVGNDTRTWIEGKFIIFDDSFEHEVWHDGSELRLVLIVDFWHPELTAHQKRTLSPI